jgi:hypothetical protein
MFVFYDGLISFYIMVTMTTGEYYDRCARLMGYYQSPKTTTFVYYQAYLAKIEEEKFVPGFSLKRCKSVDKDIYQKK